VACEVDRDCIASRSPDSGRLAFLRFDESQVPVFQFPLFELPIDSLYAYKYPQAGANNSIVKLGVCGGLNRLCMCCMAKNPADFHTAPGNHVCISTKRFCLVAADIQRFQQPNHMGAAAQRHETVRD